MLVLTRKKGEVLVIGDDISITFLETRGAQVRVGIEAPRSVSVHRKEIYDRIQSEKAEKEGNTDSANKDWAAHLQH